MDEESAPSWPAPPSGPTLELEHPPARGPWSVEIGSPSSCHVVALKPGYPLVLGSGAAADVRVDDRTVSACHVRLEAAADGVAVADLGSKNGVYFGGARASGAWLAGTPSCFVVGRTTVTVRMLADGGNVMVAGEPIPGLVGGSLPMRRLAGEIRRCAGLRAPVLLLGESGSGKDVVARAIHRLGRREGPYVPLNVGAVPETLADAELFGHQRGAFTGAVAARPGAFEAAHRGTLFLDEIADLPPGIQVKLLRVVEDRMVRPLGSARAIEVDVRVLSATWAPLEERVAAGRFRADLYHRISTFVLHVPPLRSRKSDIPLLARAILSRMRDDVGPKELGSGALARLVEHSWPGNVRELGSVLYRAAVAADGGLITADCVNAALSSTVKARPRPLSRDEAQALLGELNGNVSGAARAAGVPRSTFRFWLEKPRSQN